MIRIVRDTARWTRRRIFAGSLVIAVAISACLVPPAPAAPLQQPPPRQTPGCTTFYAFDGRTALAGNNEDFRNPLTYLWFVPATSGRFGCVYFGYEDGIPQGGLNDQGVFFDGLALPHKPMPITSKRPSFPGGDLALLNEVLSRSADVHDAVNILGQWNRVGGEYSQLFYGDRSGNAAIVDGDTVVWKDAAFLLATNFRISDLADAPYPEARYGTLKAMFETAQRYDVELCRQALDVAHAEGDYPTLYSQIYDLNSGTIRVYQYHDFEHEVVLDLGDELSRGPRTVAIASLFPKNAALTDWAKPVLEEWRSGFEGRARADVDPGSQDWMCGDYVLHDAPSGSSGRVSLEGSRLRLEAPGQPAAELLPSSPSAVFHPYVNGMDLTLTFERNLWGQATGAQGTLSFEPYGIERPYDMTRRGVLDYRETVLVTVAGILALLVAVTVIVVARRRARRTETYLK